MLFTSSCALTGLNPKHRTPIFAGKYPDFSEADTLFGALTAERESYDIHYYNLNIAIDPENQSIRGYSDIAFIAVEELSEIQVDLYENMAIDAILWNKDTLEYVREYKAVFIQFPENLTKNENHSIRFHYSGKPVEAPRPPWEGGFVWEKDENDNHWIGVACEVTGASLWRPVKEHLSDEADSVRLEITIPKDLVCVSNGNLLNHTVNEKTETYVWKTRYPINTYNTTLYIGDYKKFSIPYHSAFTSFDMDFYVLPYNFEKANTHFQQTVDIVYVFEQLFGPYPWPREGFKLIESPYAGMEHQTAIAYGNKYENMAGLNVDHIILHETAHEWWGNSLSVIDFAEVWIHEGFATYSEALYLEKTESELASLQLLSFYSMLIRNKRPIVGPFDVNYWKYKDTDLYMKGALTLHTLRNAIQNDSIFFDILKSFYNNHKYGFASTVDFIDLVNQKTNDDYQWFFDQYLYSRVCPELEIRYNHNSNTNTNELRYKWTKANDDFKLPIQVFTGEEYITIVPTRQEQTLNLGSTSRININPKKSYIAVREK
jgi:aminopeptidase N